MKEYAKRPVTFRAEQYTAGVQNAEDISEILAGTRVRLREDGRIQFPPPPYHSHGYVENGPSMSLWVGEWVVVSSLGEVRVVSNEDFEKEFVEND